jgi:hypothetical protein
MKFTIEVSRSGAGGPDEVLHRVTADEISPKRIKEEPNNSSNSGAAEVRPRRGF